MSLRIFQVDAFAEEPFRGNPAAVCILEQRTTAEWMQSVAAEMNLSETAFVLPGEELFGLRWFTPEAEVDLCGHATLASAHVLWETGRALMANRVRYTERDPDRHGLGPGDRAGLPG